MSMICFYNLFFFFFLTSAVRTPVTFSSLCQSSSNPTQIRTVSAACCSSIPERFLQSVTYFSTSKEN